MASMRKSSAGTSANPSTWRGNLIWTFGRLNIGHQSGGSFALGARDIECHDCQENLAVVVRWVAKNVPETSIAILGRPALLVRMSVRRFLNAFQDAAEIAIAAEDDYCGLSVPPAQVAEQLV